MKRVGGMGLSRKNNKNYIINYENSIQKSNQFSMAKMSHGLSLNQMQLFAFAIYSTQKDGTTNFQKAEFENKFSLDYKTSHAKEDVKKLYELGFSVEDLESDYFEYQRVFQKMSYDKGTFEFKWAEDVIPHILYLKEKHTTIDLTVTSKFKSAFSWSLYDYLKSHYGYWHKELSKIEMMKLFGVEDKKTYLNNTGRFKTTVLDVALKELNQFTELEVWSIDKKKGRAIIGFDLHWSIASKQESAATEKQLKEITTIIEVVESDMWNYLEVLDDMDIEKLQLMNVIQKVLKCRLEVTTTLTSTKAKEILLRLKGHLRSLESQLENARRKKEIGSCPKYVPFYNWLDERE